MSEVYQFKISINPSEFDQMIIEPDLKKYFKERLAHELARKLVETDRVSFTYTRDPASYMVRLKATVKL